MNKYIVELIDKESNPEIMGTDHFFSDDDNKEFTLRDFLKFYEDMKEFYDYSESYIGFFPVGEGTVMYRKGNDLEKCSKREYYIAKLHKEILGV